MLLRKSLLVHLPEFLSVEVCYFKSSSDATGSAAASISNQSGSQPSGQSAKEPAFVVTVTWTTADSTRVTVLTLQPDTTATPTSTTTSSPTASPEPHTNTAAIAGGVVGGVLALAVLGLCLFFLRRRKRKRHDPDSQANIRPTPSVRAWSKPELHGKEHQPRREELQGSKVPQEMLERRDPRKVSELPANEEVRRERPGAGELGGGTGNGTTTTGTEETLREGQA